MKTLITLPFVLLILFNASGQTVNYCDTIYDQVDSIPKYQNGAKGLMDYLSGQLEPEISGCMERNHYAITNLHTILTIDRKGKVIDAVFSEPYLPVQCKEELKAKLLTMTGWTPALLHGNTVCSHYKWSINCLLWSEE